MANEIEHPVHTGILAVVGRVGDDIQQEILKAMHARKDDTAANIFREATNLIIDEWVTRQFPPNVVSAAYRPFPIRKDVHRRSPMIHRDTDDISYSNKFLPQLRTICSVGDYATVFYPALLYDAGCHLAVGEQTGVSLPSGTITIHDEWTTHGLPWATADSMGDLTRMREVRDLFLDFAALGTNDAEIIEEASEFLAGYYQPIVA